MFKPYYDIRGKIGAKDLLPLTSASTLGKQGSGYGLIDMMMFSINPMYDYGQGDFPSEAMPSAMNCIPDVKKKGVGISVMKPFNAGQLFPLMTIKNHSNLASDDRVYGLRSVTTPISSSPP